MCVVLASLGGDGYSSSFKFESSSSRVRVEFELMVELAHARSIFSFYSPDSHYG